MGDDLGAFEQHVKKNFTRLEVLLDNLWAEFEQVKVNLVDFTSRFPCCVLSYFSLVFVM